MRSKDQIEETKKEIECLETKLDQLIEDSYDKLADSDKDDDIVDLAREFANEVEDIIEELKMLKDNMYNEYYE